MALTLPKWFTTPWADGGTKTEPSGGKLNAGYPSTGHPKPIGVEHNWLFNFAMNGLLYLARSGLPSWGADYVYAAGCVVRDPSDGAFYVAIATPNVGTQPHSDPTKWRAFTDASGFPAGNWMSWQETWRGDETITATGSDVFELTDQRWNVALVAGGANGRVAVQSDAVFGRLLRVEVGTGVLDLAEASAEIQGTFASGTRFAVETHYADYNSTDKFRPSFGMAHPAHDFHGDDDDLVGAIFMHHDGEANWKTVTGDGAARTTTDTGVAFDGTAKRLTVRWTGTSALFYINGALVTTHTTHLPSAWGGGGSAYAAPVVASKRDTGTSQRFFDIGPVRWSSSLPSL